MRYITKEEFAKNIDKYLSLADKEDIIVIKGGKPAARLTSIQNDRLAAAYNLFGALCNDNDIEKIRAERLSKK